jgi:hypothetical protein
VNRPKFLLQKPMVLKRRIQSSRLISNAAICCLVPRWPRSHQARCFQDPLHSARLFCPFRTLFYELELIFDVKLFVFYRMVCSAIFLVLICCRLGRPPFYKRVGKAGSRGLPHSRERTQAPDQWCSTYCFRGMFSGVEIIFQCTGRPQHPPHVKPKKTKRT